MFPMSHHNLGAEISIPVSQKVTLAAQRPARSSGEIWLIWGFLTGFLVSDFQDGQWHRWSDGWLSSKNRSLEGLQG